MLKPICVPCQRFFRPAKNGFPVIEGMPKGNGVKPGTEMADQWEPYKLWMGDLWSCPGCNANIVIGIISHQPISEHYQYDFKDTVEKLNATFQVNDC